MSFVFGIALYRNQPGIFGLIGPEGRFKEAVNRWLLPGVCFSVLHGAGACGVAKAIYKQFIFPTWACAAGFNNNNNNNNIPGLSPYTKEG